MRPAVPARCLALLCAALAGCAGAVRYRATAPDDPEVVIRVDHELSGIVSRNRGPLRFRVDRMLYWAGLGGYAHQVFCAEMERQGWYSHPVPQGEDPGQAQQAAERDRRARRAYRPLAYVPEMRGARLAADPDPATLGRLFGPDRSGSVEQSRYNSSFRPRAPGTVPCMCVSAARGGEVLMECPASPYAPKP